MRILALEPYYGGSHKAFLDGWSARSSHTWTVLTLPAYKWKWRMRHAAITLAEQVAKRVADGGTWDIVFCSDMLNLAEFKGLAPPTVQRLPSIVYFHENQLTYPVRHETERDYHFVMTNITTALAATQVWFNSAYHRDSFLGALPAFLKRMPDHQPLNAVELIRGKSHIHPQGINSFPTRPPREDGPIRLLWAARWEHDKDPDTFFSALKTLKSRGIGFRLSVVGERFREAPPIFEWAKEYFAAHIDRWGYQESRDDYEAALREADVIVSTANHEFFGISVVEAIAAGAYPLLPRRLAYPEILTSPALPNPDEFFHDGAADELARKLKLLADRVGHSDLWQGDPDRAARTVARFHWTHLAPCFDRALEQLAGTE